MKRFNLNFIKIFLTALFGLVSFVPALVSASSVTLSSANTNYHVGDSFLVTVKIDAGSNSVNTISGKISIPADYFQVSNLRYGNSIVTLWVEKPALNESTGQIIFSGGIPGGFNSRTGTILSFSLKAKKVGSSSVSTSDIKVLLNDGQGTELAGVATPNLNINITKALPVSIPTKVEPAPIVETYIPPTDNLPPEAFIPLISRHPSVADNSYFVSFSAVDKDSGIAYYEVKETPWLLPLGEKGWSKAESPYVLKNQLWMSKVSVRAFDQKGNFIDAESFKPIDPIFAVVLTVVIIALIIYLRRLSTKKPTRVVKKVVKSNQ